MNERAERQEREAARREWWASLSPAEQEAYLAQQKAQQEADLARRRSQQSAEALVAYSTHSVTQVKVGDRVSFFLGPQRNLVTGQVERAERGLLCRNTYSVKISGVARPVKFQAWESKDNRNKIFIHPDRPSQTN
jgi:hypothetical protein